MRKGLLIFVLLLVLASMAADVIDPRTFALRVHDEVNASRIRNGLPALIWLEDLADLALLHSRNMGQNGFFSHQDPAGMRVSARQQKYRPDLILSEIGENLYRSKSSTRVFDPKKIALGWMNSSGHRENILKPGYTHSGVGIYVKDDSLYATQVFATPIMKLRMQLPPFFEENALYLLEFEYLSKEPRKSMIGYLATPDPTSKVVQPDGSYYLGAIPLTFDWQKDKIFLLPLDFKYGTGSYILKIGWDDYVYPDLMEFKVR